MLDHSDNDMLERMRNAKPAFVTHFNPPLLPGVERVDYGRCSVNPFEPYDHMVKGCAHWHVGTGKICVAPCIPEPDTDTVPVPVLHEYAHFLVGGDTSGNSIVIAHGRKWRDKFSDLLELHNYEPPVPFDAHVGACDQTFTMREPSDDSCESAETCDFEVRVTAMVWNIFHAETTLRKSTVEDEVQDFMARFTERKEADRTIRSITSTFATRPASPLKTLSVPVSLTLRKSTVDAFVDAATDTGVQAESLVVRYMEQMAFSL